MKMNKLVTCACIATVGVAYLLAGDKTKTSKPTDQVTMTSSTGKIAFVDSQKLTEGYYRVKELNDALTIRLNAIQQELKSMFSEYEKVAKEYQELSEKANNPALTEEGKQKAQALASAKLEVLKQKESAVRAYREKAEDELVRQREDEGAKITDTIKKVIEEQAQLGGYSAVFDIATPSVVYHKEGLDITDPVLKILNIGQPKAVAASNTSVAAAKK